MTNQNNQNQFFKYSALGNVYIVIDPKKFSHKLDKNLITKICDRNFGMGSDGILYGPFRKSNFFSMLIFNPDGTQAEKSGNGIRIFSKYLKDNGYIPSDLKKFKLHTKGGIVEVEFLEDKEKSISVNMGKPVFSSKLIPLNTKDNYFLGKKIYINGTCIEINCVSMGNPHCIVFTDKISKENLLKIAPNIEKNTLFPNRTNVQFVQIVDSHNVKIEIWERGAGYTLSSGSSSCAVGAVCFKRELAISPLLVHMRGGKMTISCHDGHIYMVATVKYIGNGYFYKNFLF